MHLSSKFKLPILKMNEFSSPSPPHPGDGTGTVMVCSIWLGSAGETEGHREQSCCRDAAVTFILCSPGNNFRMNLCR